MLWEDQSPPISLTILEEIDMFKSSKSKGYREGLLDSVDGLVNLVAAFLKPWSKAADDVLSSPKKPDDLPLVMWEDARTAIRNHRVQHPKPNKPKNRGFAR